MNITGHIKTLTKDEWIEGYNSYILTAKILIARAKRSTFGRAYYLDLASTNLDMAGYCVNVIKNS